MKLNSNEIPFLTGLRGVACLLVFCTHTPGGGFLGSLSPYGRYGVEIFFLLSAVTLFLSLDISEKSSSGLHYFKYLTRRFFRIAPLYYLICIVAFLMGGNSYYKSEFGVSRYDLNDLLMHLSFANIFVTKFKNTLTGVEWSIPIEVFWYFLIPIIFIVGKMRWIPLLLFPILSILTYQYPWFGIKRFLGIEPGPYALQWAPQKYAYIYLFGYGIYSFLTNKSYSRLFHLSFGMATFFTIFALIANEKAALPYLLVFSAIILISAFLLLWNIRSKAISYLLDIGILFFTGFSLYQYSKSGTGAVGMVAVLLLAIVILEGFRSNVFIRSALEFKAILFIGNLSFSIYLIHMIVITNRLHLPSVPEGILEDLFLFSCTLSLSFLTYRFIEKPFILFGKQITAVKSTPTIFHEESKGA